jgi:hypothetical protein
MISRCSITGGSDGIDIDGNAPVTIDDCSISENSRGAVIGGCYSSLVTIEDCAVSRNGTGVQLLWGASMTMPSTAPPLCEEGPNVEVIRSHVVDNGTGVQLFGGSVSVRESYLATNLTGIDLTANADAYILDSLLSHNGCGVGLSGNSLAVIYGCSIEEHKDEGVLLRDNAKAVVTNCTLSHSSVAVWLSDSASVRMADCEVLRNTCGVDAMGNAEAEVLSCVIDANAVGVRVSGSPVVTLEGNLITGNRTCGVAAAGPDCLSTTSPFEGRVAGKMNTIVGLEGHPACAVCPVELQFLTTEEGGALDLRE